MEYEDSDLQDKIAAGQECGEELLRSFSHDRFVSAALGFLTHQNIGFNNSRNRQDRKLLETVNSS